MAYRLTKKTFDSDVVYHDRSVFKSCTNSFILYDLSTFSKTLPLIDWISDTRPHGCTDLQSSVKCRIIGKMSDKYAVKQGCAMH